ncbi:hypothetical protein N9K73_03590 [Candidatus Poseidoniales archaeon]|nr:hypothetical protein [Candidatus Poseidoniales archaeon]
MEFITLSGLQFQRIDAQSMHLGTDKGGWIYAGQRPRHEVRLPTYYIMTAPLTGADYNALVGTDDGKGGDQFRVTAETLKALMVGRGNSMGSSVPFGSGVAVRSRSAWTRPWKKTSRSARRCD